MYGGSSRPVPLDPGRAGVAEHAVLTVAERLGADLSYARVDLMEWDGAWVVSELELIEPGLYLDVAPDIAGPFADLVADRLGRVSAGYLGAGLTAGEVVLLREIGLDPRVVLVGEVVARRGLVAAVGDLERVEQRSSAGRRR